MVKKSESYDEIKTTLNKLHDKLYSADDTLKKQFIDNPNKEEKHRQRRWNRSTRFLNCGKSQQRIDASVVVPYEMTSCFCKDCGRWVFQHCSHNRIYCGECGSFNVEITCHLITSAAKRKCVLTKERLENKYKYNKK